MLLCTACGGQQSNATEPSGTIATATEIEYSVAVVDDLGNPVTEGVIVNFCIDEQVVAMQVVDGNGVAKKTLSADNYTVSLSYTDPNADYSYLEDVVVTPENCAATVTLSGYLPGQLIYAGGKDHFAYFVTAGTTAVQVTANDRTYFLFKPEQSGIYAFSTDSSAVIGYYGAPHFVQDQCAVEVSDGKFTLSISNSMLGSIYVLGIDATSNSTYITIDRIGDAEKTIEDYPWTIYQPTTELKPFVLPQGMALVDFDLTAETDAYQLVYNEKDGYYHLGTDDGEVVYMKLGVASAYLDSMVEVLDVSNVACYFFGEDCAFVKKETYNECLLQYVANMDEAAGVYPLTQDLYYIIHQRGEYVGWWKQGSATYLFVDDNGNPVVGLNTDLAWLFLCCYGQEGGQSPVDPEPTDPAPVDPEFQLGTMSSERYEVFYHEIAEAMAFQAKIAAGEYVAFDLYRMFDMVLTIESETAYLVFNGDVILPEDGVLTFPLVYGTNDVGTPCSIYIGNCGSEDMAYAVGLHTILGTQNNPETLPEGAITVSTRDGDYQGYYYQYIATRDGYLVVTFDDIDIEKDCLISIYNHNSYVYSSVTNGEVFLEVYEGDEVEVVVAVLDESDAFPAAKVTITVTFEE